MYFSCTEYLAPYSVFLNDVKVNTEFTRGSVCLTSVCVCVTLTFFMQALFNAAMPMSGFISSQCLHLKTFRQCYIALL